jgi:hypothetical protein
MKPRWAVIALATVVVWTVVVLVWASQPLTDNVPVGTKDAPRSVSVSCPAPWSTDSSPTDTPVPDLTGAGRGPCAQVHRQAQLLLAFDLLVSVVAVVLLVRVLVRHTPDDEPVPPTAATSAGV